MARTIPKSDISGGGDFDLIPQGWQRLQVTQCDEKRSGKGHLMYNLTLESLSNSTLKMWDIIMLEGAGNGIGTSKLLACGGATDLGEELSVLEAHEMVGVRMWGYVAHEKYEGKDRAKIDIRFGEAGYQPITWTPSGTGVGGAVVQIGGAQGVVGPDDDDIPF